MTNFDQEYNERQSYYGNKPHHEIVYFFDKYDILSTGKALDLGCGDGKNTFFLAEKGYQVTAVDQSSVGVKKIVHRAKKLDLPIQGIVADATSFPFPPTTYNFVLSYTMLDHVDAEVGYELIQKIKLSLLPGGYVFIAVFNDGDPGFTGNSHSETGHHLKHFFKKGELLSLFRDYQIIKYQDEYYLDQTHGNPHYHDISRLMAVKPLIQDFK